ncbi:cell wall protein RBR3 isoform X1 [Octopus sinensis]|uniref:Cell wall protein RBR3 isoform X1 n=1 Tax=Octopus sinensis TaxID=2607531 RepID=A0A6P7SCH4_9MOLL|nr:cell wall protein RBR3 isoform X1 [Octopus sinensis]
MENESFSTILSHIYQDLVENFDLTNRLEKLKTFAANHPFITMFGIFTIVLCSVPVACFFAFTLFSIFLTFGGFMFLEGSEYSISSLERYLMEQFQLLTRCPQAMSSDNPEQNISTGFNESQAGTVLTFATIILGGVLILMGVLSIVFSLSVAVGLFVFHKSIDVFNRFHQQFQHAHNYHQQQQRTASSAPPQSPPSDPPSPPSAPSSQPDNSTSDNNPVITSSPTNTIYPSLASQLATSGTTSSVPVENLTSTSPTRNTVLTSTPVGLSANNQANNVENIIESNQSQSVSNTELDHEMLARHDTPNESQISSTNENVELLGGLADAVSMTPRSFVDNSNLRHRSSGVPVSTSNQQPTASMPEVSHDVMTSSLDSSANLISDSNTVAVNAHDISDGLNWDTSSSSSSSLNPGDQWEVLPSHAERTQDSSAFSNPENIH